MLKFKIPLTFAFFNEKCALYNSKQGHLQLDYDFKEEDLVLKATNLAEDSLGGSPKGDKDMPLATL